MSKLADWIRRAKRTSCSVVVVAAGSSSRMGEDKLFLDLGGMPVLARTLLAFEKCDFVDEIVLVTREASLDRAAELCRKYAVDKVNKVIIGGRTRTESSLAGLTAIDRAARIVLIHDGARPLVSEEVIRDAMHTAALYKCAAPAVPVNDTVKEAEQDVVIRTLDRSRLSAVQTPQAFIPDLIKAALTSAIKNGKEYTDDCAALEAMGIQIHLSRGDAENIKITRPVDLQTAEAILKSHGN